MRILLLSPLFPLSFWSMDWGVRLLGRKTVMPPLGLITVAGMLPADWELRLVDRNVRDVSEDDWAFGDVVFLTGMVAQRADALALVAEARRRGKLVVAGGPYANSLPDELVAAGVDILVRGEAEPLADELIRAVQERKSGLLLHSQDKPELSASPIPRFDLLDLDSYSALAVQTSRGCPFDCEFCDITATYGRKMRAKSPDQVIAELEALVAVGYRREVFLSDDNFIGDKQNAKALLRRLADWLRAKGSPLSFYTQVSLNLAQDRELQDLLTSANVGSVFIGLESPDPATLTAANKMQNVRHPMAEALATLRDNGIVVTGSFILGFDGETPGAGDRIRDLVEKIGLPEAMINALCAAPGTRLWQRLEGEGRLEPQATFDRVVTQGLNFRTTRPKAEILGELLKLWEDIYAQPAFLDRVLRYFSAMRPTRKALVEMGDQSMAALDVPDRRKSKAERRRMLRASLVFLFAFGVASPHRLRFWKNTWLLWRRNPSRLNAFFQELARCEALRRVLPAIRQEIADQKS